MVRSLLSGVRSQPSKIREIGRSSSQRIIMLIGTQAWCGQTHPTDFYPAQRKISKRPV